MTEAESLDEWIRKYKMFDTYPHRENLVVDNSDLSPAAAAKLISEKYKL